MLHRFSREELLIGEEGLRKLQAARVAVFGIGGVGRLCGGGLGPQRHRRPGPV